MVCFYYVVILTLGCLQFATFSRRIISSFLNGTTTEVLKGLFLVSTKKNIEIRSQYPHENTQMQN